MSDIARWKKMADDAERMIASKPMMSYETARVLARELRAAAEQAEKAEARLRAAEDCITFYAEYGIDTGAWARNYFVAFAVPPAEREET